MVPESRLVAETRKADALHKRLEEATVRIDDRRPSLSGGDDDARDCRGAGGAAHGGRRAGGWQRVGRRAATCRRPPL